MSSTRVSKLGSPPYLCRNRSLTRSQRNVCCPVYSNLDAALYNRTRVQPSNRSCELRAIVVVHEPNSHDRYLVFTGLPQVKPVKEQVWESVWVDKPIPDDGCTQQQWASCYESSEHPILRSAPDDPNQIVAIPSAFYIVDRSAV